MQPVREASAPPRPRPIAALRQWRSVCYDLRPSYAARNAMIETNPIQARIADLSDRVASLRGYL
jgi:hypothetical protein